MVQANDIASRIIHVRKTLKLKQKDFADRLGISGPSLSEIEKGKNKPNHDFLVNISREFNVNLYYLLFGEGEMFLDPTSPYVGRSEDSAGVNKDVRKFLWYFQRSPLVQYFVLGYFRSLLLKEKEAIEHEVKEYEGQEEGK